MEFETTEVDNGGTPRVVAKDVRGMNGGMLMCETRHERRQSQQQRRDNNDSQADSSSTGSNRQSQQRSRPRFRGGGPRVGDRLNVGVRSGHLFAVLTVAIPIVAGVQISVISH